MEEFATLLKTYRIATVIGNRFAGLWPRERFNVHGICYQTSESAKSDIYREFLAPINSGKVELLDSPRLVAQLCSLERRTAPGGRSVIDHPQRAHHHEDTAIRWGNKIQVDDDVWVVSVSGDGHSHLPDFDLGRPIW